LSYCPLPDGLTSTNWSNLRLPPAHRAAAAAHAGVRDQRSEPPPVDEVYVAGCPGVEPSAHATVSGPAAGDASMET